MATVYINGHRHRLSPNALIGKGGEADIFLLDKHTALKRYKEPDDPDYALDDTARRGAVERLKEQQAKLPAFPGNLPSSVVAPLNLAYHQATNNRIVGYTMRYLEGMEVLMRLGDRAYRERGGIDPNHVVTAFHNLHQTVRAIHTAGVVIGDFNDLNVLVAADGQTFMVDADSMQFGRFLCRTFTTRFVDPLNSAPDKLQLARPHNWQSDWYAFTVMLLQSLLYVGPYGGVHRPKTGRRLQHDARVLQRLTIFDGDVVYPKPALPLSVLPDELLGYLGEVFRQDKREIFPAELLNGLRWTTCTNCGLTHARRTCPACAAPGVVRQTVIIRGTVTATRLFRTDGRLLATTYQAGKLSYLYHEAGAFRREDGHIVLSGTLDPELRFRINRETTLLGKREKLFVLASGQAVERLTTDAFRKLPMFDANDQHYYWAQNGQLVRNDRLGSTYIGDILAGQTMFWVGRRFGFGFYQAGQLLRAFVFRSEGQGLNDQVSIPTLPGQLLDATCVFSDQLAWLMVSAQENGQLVNRCYVVDIHGKMVAEAQAAQGENSWLAYGIRGRLAVGTSLYTTTDEGIVQLTAESGTVSVARTFPDTEPFVSSATQLLAADNGMYAVSSQEIVLLEIR